MNDDYILNHLKGWAKLFYGNVNGKYAFSEKKGKYYVFGFRKDTDEMVNRISKAVAIYLCVGMSRDRSPVETAPVKVQEVKAPERRERRIPRIPKRNTPKVRISRFRITE